MMTESSITITKSKKMYKSTNPFKLIGSLLLGAAIGGGIAILFAPDKGSKTRRKIANKSDDLTDAMKEKFNSFIAEIEKEMEAVKEKASEFVEKGMKEAEKFKIN